MPRLITFFLIVAATFVAPVSVFAISRNIHVEWDFQYSGNIGGFRLFHEGSPICEVANPQATSMDCTIDVPDGETYFTLAAFLANGTEGELSQPYTYIFSSSLKAKLNAAPQQGESPLVVTFDSITSSGNIIAYNWMFGDGESGTGSIIDHTYIASGNYTSTLRVTDTLGATDTETLAITVTEPQAMNVEPSASISSSASVGPAPLSIEFDASLSSDSDGAIISYEWDFGDGTNGSGANIIHTYNIAGIYSAKVTVTDNGGLTNSISTPVMVSEPTGVKNIEPDAIFTASAMQGYSPLQVSFDAGGSLDPDGEIANYVWNFGDGTTGSGKTVSHQFAQPANYAVTLRVIDNMGVSSKLARRTITVLDSAEKLVPLPKRILKTLTGIYHLLLKKVAPDDKVVPEVQE